MIEDRETQLDVVERAVHSLVFRGIEAGRRELRSIARMTWATRIPLAPVISPTPNSGAMVSAKRSFNARRSAEVFVRDRFVCRYCGGRVVPRRLLVALSAIFPTELPYYAHYRLGTVHPVYWLLAAEADHLIPGSRGGDWTALANLVTACARCNTAKANSVMEEIGWNLQPVPERRWNGLVNHYEVIWELAGRPSPSYHSAFIRAFQSIGA